MRRGRHGVTLPEILIAATILAVVGVPILAVFIQSKRSISSTDDRREIRFYMKEILAKVQRVSLHTLWNYFGPEGYTVGAYTPKDPNNDADRPIPAFGMSGRLRDQLAEVNPADGKLVAGNPKDINPLGFTQDFLSDLHRAGYKGTIKFDFYTKKGLKVDPVKGTPNPDVGILHMQAGRAVLELRDRASNEIIAAWKQPIFCPAIVGRPGLKLSSCPAIAPGYKAIYTPILDQYEQGVTGF